MVETLNILRGSLFTKNLLLKKKNLRLTQNVKTYSNIELYSQLAFCQIARHCSFDFQWISNY